MKLRDEVELDALNEELLMAVTETLEALTAFGGEYGTYALVEGSRPGGVFALWLGSLWLRPPLARGHDV